MIKFPIFLIVRVLGMVTAALVLTWALHYRGGLALISENKDLIFNVHPVLMVIGLVLLNGEGKFICFVYIEFGTFHHSSLFFL